MNFKFIIISIFVGSAILAIIAFPLMSEKKTSEGKPNVIIISVDTVRADHLGCYGYERETMPNICDFAKDSLIFENAFSHTPITFPSHTTMLSGKYWYQHQANFSEKISSNLPLLAEILRDEGYDTGGFITGLHLSERSGIDRGFQTYEEWNKLEVNRTQNGSEAELSKDTLAVRPERFNNRISSWLDESEEPKFLFAHYFYPHHPYEPPEKFDIFKPQKPKYPVPPPKETEDIGEIAKAIWKFTQKNITAEDRRMQRLIGKYDASLRHTDHYVGDLLDDLERKGHLEDSVIIITSDHGEAFNEHGLMLHGSDVYNEQIKVPLIVKYPNEDPGRIESPAGLVDITPSVLDAVNISVDEKFKGKPLPYSDQRYIISESMNMTFEEFKPRNRAIIRYPRKLIVKKNAKFLYNLKDDPMETNDLSSNLTDKVNELEKSLETNHETS